MTELQALFDIKFRSTNTKNYIYIYTIIKINKYRVLSYLFIQKYGSRIITIGNTFLCSFGS